MSKSLTALLLLSTSVMATDKPTRNHSNKEMLTNFNACAANAAVLGDKYLGELELYVNAAIDIGFEASNGKVSSAMVLQGIKETAQNIKARNYTPEFLASNYKKYCGYRDTRGYASWYHEQRKNMSTTLPDNPEQAYKVR